MYEHNISIFVAFRSRIIYLQFNFTICRFVSQFVHSVCRFFDFKVYLHFRSKADAKEILKSSGASCDEIPSGDCSMALLLTRHQKNEMPGCFLTGTWIEGAVARERGCFFTKMLVGIKEYCFLRPNIVLFVFSAWKFKQQSWCLQIGNGNISQGRYLDCGQGVSSQTMLVDR